MAGRMGLKGRLAAMGESEIPWAERAIGKEEVALLLGCEPRGVLERHACRPNFPQRIQDHRQLTSARQPQRLLHRRNLVVQHHISLRLSQ